LNQSLEPHTDARPEPVVLIIADISGYTSYMTANAKTLAHSQAIITELVKAIVARVDLPLEVAKLEGDAVFLFGRKGRDGSTPPEKKRDLGQRLMEFFDTFQKKLGELSYSTTCTCNACSNIERLRLKIVVHSGEALFHKVFHFQELAGVDVIIVHRLLKNSLAASQYLLLTEAAQADVELPKGARLLKSVETYTDLGPIVTGVYYPQGDVGPIALAHETESLDYGARFLRAWRLQLKLWFRALFPSPRGEENGFRNISIRTTPLGHFGFALIVILLTPVYLPVSFLMVALHTRKDPAANYSIDHHHVHKADGSCCEKATAQQKPSKSGSG
jgi:hypothetical protein